MTTILLALSCLILPVHAQDPAPAAGSTPATEPAPVDENAPATKAAASESTPDTTSAGASTASPAPEAPATGPSAEELAARIDALEATIAAQQAALTQQNTELTKVKLKLIPPDEFKVELAGYYRTRAYLFSNLFPPIATPAKGDKEGRDARFMEHRLRLRPTFNYKDLAKLSLQVSALEDVVWGDNASKASTALFASDPSLTGRDGLERSSFEVQRAWMEFKVPVGMLRVGRMPSQWGMGLLANDGDWHDGDKVAPLPNTSRNEFGESRYGNTFDRVLFATRPVAVGQAIMGAADSGFPLITAIAVDRLVEDPLIQYNGFKCTPGVPASDPAYDPRCDLEFDDGLTDVDQDFTNDSFNAANRGQDWWADQNDDVWEMIYVLAYKGEDIDYLGGNGDLTAGVYIVNRKQVETDSSVLIPDFYMHALVHNVLLEGEAVAIRGDTRAIALPGAFDESGAVKDPLAKTANIAGYAIKGGYNGNRLKLFFEHGYASGDNNVADGDFTGRALHPDYNVGLLIYEEILARVTSQFWTDSAEGLWSRGGVYNSRYVFPTAHFFPLDNWELQAGFLTAWPDKADGAFIVCNGDDKAGCDLPASSQASASSLGWEIDVGLHHQWHEHLLFALEAAYAKTTDRLNVKGAGLNPDGKFFTLQSRIAWQF